MTWDEVDARLLQETLRVQDKPYRTRGNPSWVLRMVAKVKVKQCRICGCHHDVELHHEDGNWKNYQLHNLNWYCKQHHQEADNYILHIKENTMTKTMKGTNMKWTDDLKALLKQEIQKGRDSGLKSTMIFEEISKNSETIFGKQHTALNLQKMASKISKFQLLGTKPPQNTTVTTQHQPEEITLQQLVRYDRMATAAGYILR